MIDGGRMVTTISPYRSSDWNQDQDQGLVMPETSSELALDGYFNRDLSWLEFNRRVLHEAQDSRTPLLERVRFLQIFSTNLDEFFMKRMGTLHRLNAASRSTPTRDGLTPGQQLEAVRPVIHQLLQEQAACFHKQLRPLLVEAGIELLAWDELRNAERDEAEQYFLNNVFPILTPLAVDPGHPFPFISNQSVSLGVILLHPERPENLFARIKVPQTLPRWIALKTSSSSGSGTGHRFLSLYELIRHNLSNLFLDMKLVDASLFRVTRSAEGEGEEENDETEDLRESVEEELRQRRFAPVVRLEHNVAFNAELRQLLMQEMDLAGTDLYEVPLGLEFQDLRPIIELKLPNLSYPVWTPCVPPSLADSDTDFFTILRSSGDLMVHHPYESFNASVERFVSAAAADPKVLAIKMTLYRTDDESPFIHTLIRAAEARKEVVCLVELRARFDEERNIVLTRALEKAGVHVVYGVLGLKTHSKTTLVVRQEPDGIRCYAHVGTGNYHTQTSRQYTDLGLFTADPQITGDLIELFHYLTGRSLKKDYHKLLVAPVNMKQRFLELIDREIQHARAGRPGAIVAKMNSLEDRQIIDKLYEASGAGVEIDLIVRGFCCVRPGVPSR